MDIAKAQIKAAYICAQKHMQEMTRQLSECGKAVLEGIEGDEAAVVLIGRPYNLYDEKMNFDVGKIFQENRIKALPMNFIDIGNVGIDEYPSMYWNYGNIILRTVKKISDWPNIYPVVLSNFKCGPDSFLSHFVKNISGGAKPLLELEFDEHSGKAGIETRVEAFVDSIKSIKKSTPIRKGRQNYGKVTSFIEKGSTRTLYIPHISRGSVLLSAAFRSFRIKSRPIDDLFESGCAESLQLGLKYTSGKECFPASVTLGDILYTIQKLEMMDIDIGEKAAFFMPEAHGPCRFGQYNKYIRIVMDDMGFQNVPLISLTSRDSYGGLNGLGGFNRKQFRKIGLKAILIADYLEKLLRATRAYEIRKGHAEKVFRAAQKIMVHEIESIPIRSKEKNKAGLMKTWQRVIELFKNIPVKNEKMPMIGITGEIYMRCHEAANQGLEKAIEKFGGECYVPPITEWIMYTAYMKKWQAMQSIRKSGFNFSKVFLKDLTGALKTIAKYGIEQWYQSYQEHLLHKPLNGFIERQKDTPVHKILEYSQYYSLFDKELYGEGILTLGSIIDFAERNFGGIIVSMPFGCMPGTNVDAILPKARKVVRRLSDRNIPILTCIDDETRQPNRELMLQLLIEQAKNDLK